MIVTAFSQAPHQSLIAYSLQGDTVPDTQSDTAVTDTVPTEILDSTALSTLTHLDSLKAQFDRERGIDGGNPKATQWNDSIAAAEDSIMKTKKKSALDEPVEYEAKDSIVFFMDSKNAYLYGESKVNYTNMQLTSENIAMNMDSSIVHATPGLDSLGVMYGKPVFQQGDDEYVSEKMDYNFETRKGFITGVETEQEEGFLYSEESKKGENDELYLRHGRYTTCDEPHPHFYIALSRAKAHTGKDIFTGPAWLVVEDVPLPLAIPFAYFPFTSHYSSGFIMPSYGDESTRGFYLRDGGYYFAINDNIDLKLTGEIFTKGSWGVGAQTTYNRRYKYSGNFYFNYQVTVNGEKNLPDYAKTKNFKVQWSHRQDSKANPNSSFSASVNFATQSYEKNNLSSLYNPTSYAQSTRTSSVSYSRSFPKIGLSLSSSFNIAQNMRDSTISLTLPSLSISLARLYPFKRKHAAGKERWYEKISLNYTGTLSNSINTKEDKLLGSNLIKDWSNGMKHTIPISASFNILNYINVTPSIMRKSCTTPLARAIGPTQPKSLASCILSTPTPLRRMRTVSSSKKIGIIVFNCSRSFLIWSINSLRPTSSISLRTPPTLQTEKITRPPVVCSKMSSTSSRKRQLCINRLSKPIASAAKPSHNKWL